MNYLLFQTDKQMNGNNSVGAGVVLARCCSRRKWCSVLACSFTAVGGAKEATEQLCQEVFFRTPHCRVCTVF